MLNTSHRLLSLDGGGIRGLSSLQILKQLMVTIDPDQPPKPCDYFSMIGGTSTGGLIAIMLGRLEMTIDDCIKAYTALSDKVFQKRQHRLKINGQFQGRFDSQALEQAIKDIVVSQGLDADAELQSAGDTKCKVFVCTTAKDTNHVVNLRSYYSPRCETRTVKIWEAGRATSAATSFFDPITFGNPGETFVDGALGANNPIYEVWNEAQDLWQLTESSIQCIVSIGTGLPRIKPFKDDVKSIGESLVKIATETEATAERFIRDKRALYERGRYYRFNVVRGLEGIALEGSDKQNVIITATNRYIESQAVFKQIKACAVVMRKECEYLSPSQEDDEALKTFEEHLLSQWISHENHETSSWLFYHPEYCVWDHDGLTPNTLPALLTLKGKPGAGKTVLVKQAIKAQLNKDGMPLVVASYFFEGHTGAPDCSITRTPNASFFGSILGQLLRKVPRKPWSDIRRWSQRLEKNPHIDKQLSNEFRDAIKQIVVENRTNEKSESIHFRIFVDGLSEITSEDLRSSDEGHYSGGGPLEVLQFISELLTDGLANEVDVRACISRRHIPQFGAKEPISRVIDVDRHNTATIRDYIATQLERLDNRTLAWRLYNRLVHRSTNGFRWTSILINRILERKLSATPAELEQLIDESSDEFDQLYGTILTSFRSSRDSQGIVMLQIALCSFRPMTPDQFRHALAFAGDFKDKYESIQEWEQSPEGLQSGLAFETRIQQMSCGLLEVATYEPYPSFSESSDPRETTLSEVRFIQHSVANFLRGNDGLVLLNADSSKQLHQKCHFLIFERCLRVLDLCDVEKDENNAFLDYASEFWLHHAREAGELLDGITDLPTFVLKCKQSKVARVIGKQKERLQAAQAKEFIYLQEHSSMLVLLATMGCTKLLDKHLQKCQACKRECSKAETGSITFRTALNNSILAGWTDMALRLLEVHCQGDINALSNGRTLLFMACYFHHTELVRFLLKHGADPTARSLVKYEYPLHVAIALGYKDVVVEILSPESTDTEAIFRCRCEGGLTALHFAVDSGRPPIQKRDILNTILEYVPHGAGLLDLKDDEGFTPIDIARDIGGPDGRRLEEALEDFQDDEDL